MTDPISDLIALSLNDDELAFIYFGWAGILLKAKRKIIAFDLCNYVLNHNKLKVDSITSLDLQFNSHVHGDHFDLKTTTQIFQQTGAKMITEPRVFEKLKGKVPDEALFSGNPYKPLYIDDFRINSIEGIHPSPITIWRVHWEDVNVFHGADSGHVPLENYLADLAFIPTGSPSPSCSPEKGLKMAMDVKPEVVITMHGAESQMTEFKGLVAKELPETKVVIPEANKVIKIPL
jgi:L-ascorbate metabolism protein UlaG (beta-lactamase superfamily)